MALSRQDLEPVEGPFGVLRVLKVYDRVEWAGACRLGKDLLKSLGGGRLREKAVLMRECL